FLILRNYKILLKFLWLNNWYNYKHNRVRVRNTAIIHLYTYSLERIRELVKSTFRVESGTGLHYRVSILYLRQSANAKYIILPQHPIYKGRTILLINPIIFLLIIALVTEAFRDYSTLEEILAVRPALDIEYVILK
ncbi:hypothetical protein K432DRAFT_312917, partial [Lepidopterella palustris CBS 459.81]